VLICAVCAACACDVKTTVSPIRYNDKNIEAVNTAVKLDQVVATSSLLQSLCHTQTVGCSLHRASCQTLQFTG
jgi:hypothetical protein